MNKWMGIGRITKDLEMKVGTSGKAFLPFTIAVKRKRSDETDFVPCVAFGKTAELINTHFAKGHRISIEGRLEISSQKKDGNWVTYTNIVTEDFGFIESKNESKRDDSPMNKIQDVDLEKILGEVQTGLQEVEAKEEDFDFNPFKSDDDEPITEEQKELKDDMFKQFEDFLNSGSSQ